MSLSPHLRLPLIPRQPPPDLLEDKAQKKKYSNIPPSSIPDLAETSGGDLDQQLIFYAYNTAVVAIASMVLYG